MELSEELELPLALGVEHRSYRVESQVDLRAVGGEAHQQVEPRDPAVGRHRDPVGGGQLVRQPLRETVQGPRQAPASREAEVDQQQQVAPDRGSGPGPE